MYPIYIYIYTHIDVYMHACMYIYNTNLILQILLPNDNSLEFKLRANIKYLSRVFLNGTFECFSNYL